MYLYVYVIIYYSKFAFLNSNICIKNNIALGKVNTSRLVLKQLFQPISVFP